MHPSPENTRRLTALTSLAPLALALLLAACGGSDGRGDDTLAAPQPIRRCEGCLPGRLSGHVHLAGLRADVAVHVLDANAARAEGSTDSQGRYDIDVAGLTPPLLVQAKVAIGGRLERLHAAARQDDIGVHAVSVTLLSELMVTDALGGHPADLLQLGRADVHRLDAGIAAAERRVARLVQPVLDSEGVAAGIDLRTTALPGNPALQRALSALDVAPAGPGGHYAVRHLATAPEESLVIAPGTAGEAQVLPRPSPDDAASVAAGVTALPALQQQLDNLSALFATDVPGHDSLQPWVAADLRHGGLAAVAFIDTVLRRVDAPAQGGYSLQGARFGQLRLLEARDGGRRLRVAFRISARAPHAATDEALWVARGDDGRWRLQGDGQAANVRVRNLALLGPRPLDDAAVHGLAGVNCSAAAAVLNADAQALCRIDGGQGGVADGGWLDLGRPGEAGFGLRGLYRSEAADALQRLADYGTHSRRLGEASAQVTTYLSFEIDARRVDARAVRAVVTGPGLPAEGWALHPPARKAGAPVLQHWTVDETGLQDWHAVRVGDCGQAAADGCTATWAALGTGSRYRFELLDAAGGLLQALDAGLPSAPRPATTLWAERERWFARWDLAARPADQPTLAALLASRSGSGDTLRLGQRWTAPSASGSRMLAAEALWDRAAPPPAAADPQQLRQRWAADGSGALDATLPAAGNHRTIWLALLLHASDALGNRYLHMVSPDNPY